MNKLTSIRIIRQDGSPSDQYPVSTLAQQVLLTEGSTETLVDALNNIQSQLNQLSSNKIDETSFNDEKEELQNNINKKLNISDFNERSLKFSDLKDSTVQSQYESIFMTPMQNRQYPVTKDKSGKLSVNVPWKNINNHAELGQGFGICQTSSQENEKQVSLSNYVRMTGGVISIYFENNVLKNASLNINDTGAKNIYYKNSPLIDEIILAGDTVTFIFDGYYFRIISIDRNNATNDGKYFSMTNEQSENETSDMPYLISPKILNTRINGKINSKKLIAEGKEGIITFSIE